MTPTDVSLEHAGRTFHLLPERALFWEHGGRTLLVADPHFGKAAAFRVAGVPVPAGTTGENLARLDAAVDRCGAERIVFLGDFLHSREGRAKGTLERLQRWRASRSELDLVLVRGNHDRHAGDPPAELQIRCVEEPWVQHGLALGHQPRAMAGHFLIGGHLHPAARLYGLGRQAKRLPCFWFREQFAVLPAFGDFTGVAPIEAMEGDRVFVVAGGEVVEVRGR